MPIISKIGRKALATRFLVGVIYILLITGSITMVYPFLLMIAGSTKSGVDTPEAQIIPEFLRSESGLYKKHMEAFFNEGLDMLKSSYDSDIPSFRKTIPPDKINAAFAGEWEKFLGTSILPHYYYMIGSWSVSSSKRTIPYNLRKFKGMMMRRFDGDISQFNAKMEVDMANWNAFSLQASNFLMRRFKVSETPLSEEIYSFKENTPVGERYYFCPEGFYKASFLKVQYSKDLAAYNADHGTNYESWNDIHLDRKYPDSPAGTDKEKADWEIFVRTILNLFWIRATPEATPVYREFLKAKYADIDAVNKIYSTSYASFEDISMPEEAPHKGIQMADWDSFLQGWKNPIDEKIYKLPIKDIRIHSVEFLFRDYLKTKFGDIAKVNGSLGTSSKNWNDFFPPQRDFHYLDFKKKMSNLRWEYCARNFYTVLDFFLFHGRAVFNTVVYCLIAIVAALIVNPIAAYALSRYRPASAYKILLILMLTMAFPPMVTQIPVFLMMRSFNLLNTFAALILPGLANGYSIFLLKGFFDSLPKELYESASIDGAGEFQMFWKITMSLSTPILAVIALGAFNFAYCNFMFALLICQDQSMWTLMPWLYQLQMQSCQGIVFSSLVVAAIPTFIIFSLCQNIIMRGIVVPSEK